MSRDVVVVEGKDVDRAALARRSDERPTVLVIDQPVERMSAGALAALVGMAGLASLVAPGSPAFDPVIRVPHKRELGERDRERLAKAEAKRARRRARK